MQLSEVDLSDPSSSEGQKALKSAAQILEENFDEEKTVLIRAEGDLRLAAVVCLAQLIIHQGKY